MNPFVLIKLGMQEWRSEVCFDGGKHPRWMLQFMEVPIFSLAEEVLIEVRDKDAIIGSEPIGRARVRLDFFAVGSGRQEWIELFHLDMPAGRLHMRSEWFPEMAGGEMMVAGGGGGGGVGRAVVEGAIIGGMLGRRRF